MQILRLLYRKPLSVEEIAKELELQAITIRHHLQALVEAGIVECHEERSGLAGRPRAYYSIAKTHSATSFPKRQYQTLSESLIEGMISELGTAKAKTFLRNLGMRMGENAIRKLESEYNITSWSPRNYEKYVVREYFEKEGAAPEVVETSSKGVIYRLHNCLFQEISVKKPEIMCDVLHDSFHQGAEKAIGKNLRISRSTCMGHGDPYCEQVCVWKS
jgi:predicted ArsR family transcriptional regulator